MRKFAKRVLESFSLGVEIIRFLKLIKANAIRRKFLSASREPFQYLNKWGQKKAIDRIYEDAFDKIFLMLKCSVLEGDVLEFGVFRGYTAIRLARNIKKFDMQNTSIHLFDSFAGLPDGQESDNDSYEFFSGAWVKGSMSVEEDIDRYIEKKISKILNKNRVHVVKGFFEDTLDGYFQRNKPLKAKLVHIDCDLYSSSKFVLNYILEREVIQDGTFVIFDDWMTSQGNPNLGQRKAAREVLERFPMWQFEQYFHYGIGSHVFVAHDLRVKAASDQFQIAKVSL